MTKLTPQELDKRIEDLVGITFGRVTMERDPLPVELNQAKAIKQLIRDCIEAVTPERDTHSHLTRNYCTDCASRDGRNWTLDVLHANTKELLGE